MEGFYFYAEHGNVFHECHYKIKVIFVALKNNWPLTNKNHTTLIVKVNLDHDYFKIKLFNNVKILTILYYTCHTKTLEIKVK